MESAAATNKYDLIGYTVSLLVLLLVVFMRKIHVESDIDFHFLPGIYSVINFLAGCTLLYGYYLIKQGRILAHKRTMTIAIILSSLFLVMYVIYHITTPDTLFCGTGNIRYVYFFVLITHIILAALSFPFIVFTYIRGYTAQYQKHKRLARFVYPVWLYVCFTGPLCYWFIYPCFPK